MISNLLGPKLAGSIDSEADEVRQEAQHLARDLLRLQSTVMRSALAQEFGHSNTAGRFVPSGSSPICAKCDGSEAACRRTSDSVIDVQVVGVRVEMPSNQPVLLLREVSGTRFLPIWIRAVKPLPLRSRSKMLNRHAR